MVTAQFLMVNVLEKHESAQTIARITGSVELYTKQ